MDTEIIFNECLVRKDEDLNNCVKGEGFFSTVIFNSDHLKKHKIVILVISIKLLANLTFSRSKKDIEFYKKIEKELQLCTGLNLININSLKKQKKSKFAS